MTFNFQAIIDFLRLFLRSPQDKAALNVASGMMKLVSYNAAYFATPEGKQLQQDVEGFLKTIGGGVTRDATTGHIIAVHAPDNYSGSGGSSMYTSQISPSKR